jgi:hypothetical protein
LQQDITRGRGMVDELFQGWGGTAGTQNAVLSSSDYISQAQRTFNNVEDGELTHQTHQTAGLGWELSSMLACLLANLLQGRLLLATAMLLRCPGLAGVCSTVNGIVYDLGVLCAACGHLPACCFAVPACACSV